MSSDKHDYALVSSEAAYDGRVVRVRRDVVAMPGGGTAQRDVVVHPGAVGVVALDGAEQVLLLRQYRHPVGRPLWELPAGLLDQSGESALAAARRELAEEASVRAGQWAVLVDALTSPGMTDEAIRVYLARDITPVPETEQHERENEEAELVVSWVPLDEAVRRVLAGDLENAMAVIGVLAAARVRDAGYTGLRAADAAWPANAELPR